MTARDLIIDLARRVDNLDQDVQVRILTRGDEGVGLFAKFVPISRVSGVSVLSLTIEDSDVKKAQEVIV